MAEKKTSTKTSTKKEQAELIKLPELDIRFMSVQVIGDTPLIVHKWSEKAKREMLDKQMKKASTGKEVKDPWKDYCNSLYWLDGMPETPTQEDLDNARFGFPAVAFKACAIDAAYQQGAISKKTTPRGAFHLMDELVEIVGKPRMREDMVQIGGMSKVADIRYRGEFPDWSATLNIRYNARAITPEQIMNMLNIGGFANGVGEWRPERDGNYGTFHIATVSL